MPLTDADNDGVFEATLQFLDPSEGPFSINIAHDDIDVTTDPASPISVAVSSGSESSQSIVVTSATLSTG